ncbi:hypothetical protein QUF63_11020 [Anaerolineales bacterium HSG25]|nr:hypothetical protein [Anaerolineales bacterium HSG25]
MASKQHSALPLLLVALVGALIFHGGLSIFGTYKYTYDAYVHIFFADHWRRSWFDHWEPRWYTGFPMVGYPPLSQQSVALLTFLTGDLRISFAIVQTGAILLMTLGMFRFARLWVSDTAAGWAAVWLAFSSAMAETIHVFGQLPTTYSLGLLLNALPFTYAWIDRGHYRDLAKSWSLTAATTGAHHVTTLFGSVFITAPVIIFALLTHFRTPRLDEPQGNPSLVSRSNWKALIMRRTRRLLPAVIRSGIFTVGTILLLVVVVFPYWYWSKNDPITQVSIPHASRDNFLINLNAGLVFWLIPYGMLIFVWPYATYRGVTTKVWPLFASIAFLALLGTGGTTPIPRFLLRGAFDILTLDRFTLWASILMLPLAGEFVVSLQERGLKKWLTEQFGPLTLGAVKLFFLIGLLVTAIFTASLTQFRRFQPAPIDTQPIVNFINKDEHWRWRYLTLGFGDQMAWLSAQTTATQVDGNYHSARRLPELTTTPIERLAGAKFRGIPGIGSLQQFLTVPEKFNLKFVFSNDQFYDPLLYFYGWHQLQRLENGIVVWERADIPVLPEILPRKEIPLYQRWMFGILPPLALVLSLLTTSMRYWLLPLALLMELLGLSRLKRLNWPRLTVMQRLWNRLDQRLLLMSDLPGNGSRPIAPWQVWIRYYMHLSLKRMKPASPTARHVRTMLLLGTLLIGLTSAVYYYQTLNNSPQRVIESYYDDLDFRRFEDAHARLNPQKRPNFDRYLLNLSLKGGLVASYGKLDSLVSRVTHQEADYMEVEVESTLITALSYYTDTTHHRLSRLEDGYWYIEPDPVNVIAPPEQFVRQSTINWLAQAAPPSETDLPDFLNQLDRPQLETMSAQLVRREDGRYSVVGELRNLSPTPADVTVTSVIYDEAGNELVWYNASDGIMHKLLPFETTPFRVDFEGVSGLSLENIVDTLSFRPNQFSFYQPPPEMQFGEVHVFAKAVPTQHDLDRAVGIQQVTVDVAVDVAQRQAQLWLKGQLINHGTSEAIIPHVLLTLYDEHGRVLWVDHHYSRESVPAQRTLDIALPISPIETLQHLPTPTNIDLPTATFQPPADFIELPPGYGYHYARFSINYLAKE